MKDTVLIFKIDNNIYHVDIPAIYNDRTIPANIIDQFDAAILEGKINKGHFVDIHKIEYAYRVNRSKKIFYKDFDRCIQFKSSDVKEFLSKL